MVTSNYTANEEKRLLYPGLKVEDSLLCTLLHNCKKDIILNKYKREEELNLNNNIVNGWITTGLETVDIPLVKLKPKDYIIKYDFSRLCDYIAFEVGHCSYSPDEFSKEEIDKILKDSGLLYPVSTDLLDTIVPKKFIKELKSYYIDPDEEITYCLKIRNKYQDYFMNELKAKKGKYVGYGELLKQQNRYLAKLMLYYMLLSASTTGVTIQLLNISENSVTILVNYNEFVDEKFYRMLSDSLIIVVCGRKFEYFPNVTKVRVGG